MSKLLSTFFKEGTDLKAKAEVHQNDLRNGYLIRYYDHNGHHIMDEEFVGNSLQFVEDAAENWVLGIKVLNG